MDPRTQALDHLARTGASARALRVAVLVYSHALQGHATTGAELGRALNMDRGQISRAVAELTDAGVLAREKRRGPIRFRDDFQPLTPTIAETTDCATHGNPAPGQTSEPRDVATTTTSDVATTTTSTTDVATATTSNAANTATNDSDVATGTTTLPPDVATATTSGADVAAGTTSSRAGARREREIPSPTDKQVSLSAGAGETETKGAMDQPLTTPRIRKILQERGFHWQRLMQGTTNRVAQEWIKAGVTEGELKAAIERAEASSRGCPDSPAYYSWAVRDEINARGQPKGSPQKSPQPGVTATGSDQQQDGKQPSKGSLHELYEKDYNRGATGTDDLPEWLR